MNNAGVILLHPIKLLLLFFNVKNHAFGDLLFTALRQLSNRTLVEGMLAFLLLDLSI